MKKTILLSFLLFSGYVLMSQNISVKEKKQLFLDHQAFFPTFGNSSDQILYTGENAQGLYYYNLSVHKETFITDEAGAIHNASISKNGDILFSNVRFVNGKRTVTKLKFSTSTGKISTLKSTELPDIVAKSKGKSIQISNPEKTEEIKPLGDYYYIWVSVSPDNQHILFTVAGKGTYISDLDGENIQELGYINAPVWLNKNWVIGMNDQDDGERITASDIIATHIKSKKKINLTNTDEQIEQYPVTSADGSKIAYHTLSGNIYILYLETKN